MNENVTVTFARAESDAVISALRAACTVRGGSGEHGGLSVAQQDLRAALRKLERASCGLAVVR